MANDKQPIISHSCLIALYVFGDIDKVNLSRLRPFRPLPVVSEPHRPAGSTSSRVSYQCSIVTICLKRTVFALRSWNRQTDEQTNRRRDSSQHCLMCSTSSVAGSNKRLRTAKYKRCSKRLHQDIRLFSIKAEK